ncbi:hypothetical protein BYT27DRAFT_7144428 [Phlegmacium glaucopus]|nr:hypothetical protein BYT27DRAFT_7144428 [Phlegmacium glaucopus]
MPIHPSLPRNPTLFLQQQQQQQQPTASTSTPSNSKLILCSTCHSQNAKYTCPGCSTHTCSLTCSTSHKSKTGCTGQRNKVAYIPMNEYGWGKMMDDYVFLEDVSRKVGDWGREIVRGGYSFGNGNGRDNRGRGRGRGGRGRGGGGSGRTKRDVLKLQLEARDIDMDLLPIGMERRKVNQSAWDFKNQTALLTIEFQFHKPPDPLAPSSQPHEPPFTLLTHKNNIKSSLLTLLRLHINTDEKNHSRKQSSYPKWAKCLIIPDADDDPESFTNPQCVMQALILHQSRGGSRTQQQPAYYSFDPSQPLINLLRHTQFVEFPTIEIWEDFQGVLVDAQGVVKQSEDERQPKRRKMNPKAGRLAINSLLGDYGSEDDDQVEEAPNVLAALDNYAESGEDDDADLASDDGGEVELDPAILLELVRQARGNEPWAAEEDDIVDWGDYNDDNGLV